MASDSPPRRRPLAGSDEDQRGTFLEEREVRSADPALSEETNERLTEELREAVGADRVTVPADRPHFSEGEFDRRRSGLLYLNQHRMTFIRTAFIGLTFAAVVALITNKWWLLPLAAGIHAVGTMTVVFGTVHLTTLSEHPSPQLAAALTEEGISSSDEHFTRLVSEFEPVSGATTADVITPNANRRTVSASEDPARAAAEQSHAMTPTAEPSQPGGTGGTPDYINWGIIVGLLIVSIIIPPVSGGGWMWLLPAVAIPVLVVWSWVEWVMEYHPDRLHRRGPGTVVGVTLAITIAVAAFCAAVAVGLQH